MYVNFFFPNTLEFDSKRFLRTFGGTRVRKLRICCRNLWPGDRLGMRGEAAGRSPIIHISREVRAVRMQTVFFFTGLIRFGVSSIHQQKTGLFLKNEYRPYDVDGVFFLIPKRVFVGAVPRCSESENVRERAGKDGIFMTT